MARLFNKVADNAFTTRALVRQIAFSCLTIGLIFGGSAFAAQKAIVKTGANAESNLPNSSPLARDMPTRQVEVVVVWGFRLRPTEHDLRTASIRSGYGELVEKSVCTSAICGFVVVHDGTKWRTTNVISGSESDLQDMHRNMERDGATLVIVHPTGTKRKIPEF
jgi:hypothetical protein